MRYIKPVSASKSSGLLAKVYRMISKDFLPVGKLPGGDPASIHSLHPTLLQAWWNVMRETVMVKEHVERNYKESIATAVSLSNDCTFCIDQHAAMLGALGDKKGAAGLPVCDLSEIVDQKQMKLIYWALSHTNKESYFIRNTPFSREEAPEIIGTALFVNYVNHLVEIFLKDSPLSVEFKLVRSVLRKINSLFLRRKAKENLEPGIFDDPDDIDDPRLSWLDSNSRIKNVWVSFLKEANKIANVHIPVDSQADFLEALSEWIGVVDERKTEGVAILGKNAMTTAYLKKAAFQPQQISEKDISALRTVGYDDKGILALTSWASLQASIRIGEWLGKSFMQDSDHKKPSTQMRVEGEFE